MSQTPEQLEQVQWIRDETMRRLDSGVQDEAIPANRQVVLEAICAAEVRGAIREREKLKLIVAQYLGGISASHSWFPLNGLLEEMDRPRPVTEEEGT